jgi:hypothetical protein
MADKPTLDEVIDANWPDMSRISHALSIAYPKATHVEIKEAMTRVSSRKVDEQNEANYRDLEEDAPQ